MIDWLRGGLALARLTARMLEFSPAVARRRGDHPGLLALPVQPGELPSAARHRRGDARHRRRLLRRGARSSSSTPPTSATASRGSSRARRSPPTRSSPRPACRRSTRPSRSTIPGPAGARPTGTAATPATPRSIRSSTAPRRPTSSSSTSTRSTARSCRGPLGNPEPHQRDQLQRFAAARTAQHRLRQPPARRRHDRRGRDEAQQHPFGQRRQADEPARHGHQDDHQPTRCCCSSRTPAAPRWTRFLAEQRAGPRQALLGEPARDSQLQRRRA